MKVGLYEGAICVKCLLQVVAFLRAVMPCEKRILWEPTRVVKQLERLAGQTIDFTVYVQPSSSKDGEVLAQIIIIWY